MLGSNFLRGVLGYFGAFILLLTHVSTADTLRETEERTRIQILYTPEGDMFPKEWLTEPVNAQAFALSEEEVERSGRIIKSAMRKYPTAVLKACLERVYVVHRLIISGVSISGTNSGNRVYIVNRGLMEGYTDAVIEATFHHEMAHVLQRRFIAKCNAAEWKKINPPGFRYSGSGLEAARKGRYFDSEEFDRTYLRDGFLTEYALSHWEEDFCIFAENLFMGKQAFWQIVERYERIERKTAMVIAFYHAIDPTFTEDYFRRLAKTPGGKDRVIYHAA